MIGIIGMGKLGSAFAQGFIKSGVKVLAYDPNEKIIFPKEAERANSPEDLLNKPRIILLSLKPADLLAFLEKYNSLLKGKVLVSPAANLTIEEMESSAPGCKFMRIMPSIAASENLSPIPYCKGKSITQEEEKEFIEIFSRTGATAKVEEAHMGIITAIVGSSPAYFAYIARAMREAAKEQGVPEETANLLLAQSLSGTGALLSKFSCEEIMEKVTTKGGVTEKGIKELESASVYQAVKHAAKLQSKK